MAILFKFADAVEPLTFDDDFTGDNGDPWNTSRWTAGAGDDAFTSIQNNKGRMVVAGGGQQLTISERNNVYIPAQEEFDVQIDWDLVSSASNGDYWYAQMTISAITGTSESPYDQFSFSLSRLYSQGAERLRVSRYDGDPLQSGYQETVDSSTSGKFRFTRVFTGTDPGHNSHWEIHGYWDVGSGWYERWDTMWGTKAQFKVTLFAANGNGNGEVTVDWDNLVKVV